MKKTFLSLLLALSLSLGMVACSSGESAEESTETTSETTTETVDYSKYLGDDGRYADYKALDYVTLPAEYRSIPLTETETSVSEETLQESIDSLLSQYADYTKITDRAIAEGDVVNIDYVGYIDGEAFSGGDTMGCGTYVTAGSSDYIDDFLTQIIGHSAGETFDVNVTFPDPYESNTDLSGKDAVFVTTINFIQGELVSPELTDSFVAENFQDSYDVTTVDELKALLAENLRSNQIYNYCLQWLYDNSSFTEMPAELLDHEFDLTLAQMEQTAALYGMSLEDLLSAYGVESSDALREMYQEDIEQNLQYTMLLQAISEAEELTVAESELAELLGLSDEDDLTYYMEQYGKGYLMQSALCQKVINLVMEDAERSL